MLQALAEELWGWDYELRMPGGVILPSRACIVRLAGDRLVVISPPDLDDAGWQQLEALGDVAYLVAPNCFHHLYIRPAAERYPQAEVHVAPGLPAKRPNLRVTSVLAAPGPASWGGELVALPVEGAPRMNEVLLLHQPSNGASKSLLATDVLFNLQGAANLRSRVMFTLLGTHDRCATSRLIKLIVQDRGAFSASVERALDAEFDRIVPAHGAILELDAKARAREALAKRGLRPAS